MKIHHDTPDSLYALPAAQKDICYCGWLTEMDYIAVRLTGHHAIKDMRIAKPMTRWYKQGLSPLDAVRRRAKWYARLNP